MLIIFLVFYLKYINYIKIYTSYINFELFHYRYSMNSYELIVMLFSNFSTNLNIYFKFCFNIIIYYTKSILLKEPAS